MNKPAVKTEIEKIISTNKQIRHQYPVAKHQEKSLTELGIIDLMPAGFGYTDAAKVIDAAQDAGKEYTDGYEDAGKMPASTLYTLLNEQETSETVISEAVEVEDKDLPLTTVEREELALLYANLDMDMDMEKRTRGKAGRSKWVAEDSITGNIILHQSAIRQIYKNARQRYEQKS
jgi:hypothetical protein